MASAASALPSASLGGDNVCRGSPADSAFPGTASGLLSAAAAGSRVQSLQLASPVTEPGAQPQLSVWSWQGCPPAPRHTYPVGHSSVPPAQQQDPGDNNTSLVPSAVLPSPGVTPARSVTPCKALTQGSLSLHFPGAPAALGFPSIFLYISVSTFFWSACFFTSLESSAWMVWGGEQGAAVISYQPHAVPWGGDRDRSSSHHPRAAQEFWGTAQKQLGGDGLILPHSPAPRGCTRLALTPRWVTPALSFLATQAAPRSLAVRSGAQG